MVEDCRTFIYRIDAENRIIQVNQEWVDFAQENQAPELTPEHVLGQPLEHFIAGWETKHLYDLIYESVRQRQRVVHIPFHCDSPTLQRSFLMHVVPLEKEALELSVEVVEIKQIPSRTVLDNSVDHSSDAVVVICSWCKRILIDENWVEIERAMANRHLFGATPPSLTHDVCPDCFATIRRQLDD